MAYERDQSGWWVATVRGVRGCHTQGRTVDEARRRIREALGLFVDDARQATTRLNAHNAGKWRPALLRAGAIVALASRVFMVFALTTGRRPAAIS